MSLLAPRHQTEMETQGWTLVPDVVDQVLVGTLNAALVPSLEARDAIRIRNGVMEEPRTMCSSMRRATSNCSRISQSSTHYSEHFSAARTS
jgi:hypothetical protein